jgi:starvation-inducible DNA-binding protein
MKPNIGLKEAARRKVATALQAVLANEIALTQATRGAHWNVVGPQFGPLHGLFGDQYDALNDQVDEIAERIRALGEFPATTVGAFAKTKTIDDSAGEPKPAAKMLASLLAAHEAVMAQLGKAIEVADDVGDSATEDFLVAVLTDHQKTAWMLRSHLE